MRTRTSSMPAHQPHVAVIGAGFAGLSAASFLARDGARVTLLERHAQAGGRARVFSAEGYTFDMGPSWYWMPDVFETYFQAFGHRVSEHYALDRLDPSYRVFFGDGQPVDMPAGLDELYALFESIEPGSARRLERFLAEAEYKYRVGIGEFVHRPGHNALDFAEWRVARAAVGLDMLRDMESYVERQFRDARLRQILKFPVLFLGATPGRTPALYSLMNYADLVLGTWYPRGGMHEIVRAMERVAREQGVEIRFGAEVEQVVVRDGRAVGVRVDGEVVPADAVVGAADYHHVEQHLLAPEHRQYTADYWERREMAPSSLLFYLGLDRRLSGLRHHNLFFDRSFDRHAAEIYTTPRWPSDPLFYVCVPSLTDPSCAPAGGENVFVLIPTAPDLGGDTEQVRDHYYDVVMERLERLTGQNVRDAVVYRRSYAEREFKADYNAFKGNAYGLANTLRQTAFFKPKMRSTKVAGLYYAGQLTTPGPGVPPSLISGQVVANELKSALGLTPKPTRHEPAAAV